MKVNIATPNGEIYNSTDIKMVVLNTHSGSIGIMKNHEPTVATLKIGVLKIVDNKEKNHYFAVSEGFSECHSEEVSIMVQTAEEASSIDKLRAEKSKQRAEERLAKKEQGLDTKRAEISLLKAITRLKVAELK